MNTLRKDAEPRPDPTIAGDPSLSARMERLRERIASLDAVIPKNRPVVFLDYPVHTNVGDLLIERGTDRFFHTLGYDVVYHGSADASADEIATHTPPDATLVLHGGGNFGDLYQFHQAFRERIIAAYPRQRIVMLPQTMHYESPARLRESALIFERHDDLHVCLRDERSLKLFSSHFRNPTYLMPDMAHFLWGEFSRTIRASAAAHTLLFARNDIERSPLPTDDLDRPTNDWSNLVPYSELVVFGIVKKLHVDYRRFGRHLPLYRIWRALVRDRLIGRGDRLIDAHDEVITNRLHMGIFSLLKGRRVTLSDNSYGKLSGYYTTWLKDLPEATLATL
jgi:pyruvyl transferase EpsO